MDIVARIKAYMEHVDLPISQFADMARIPRPTLSQILTGRNKKISNELLTKLHTAFPNLNISWLLFGDGDMDIDPTMHHTAINDQRINEKADDTISFPQMVIPGISDMEPEIDTDEADIPDKTAFQSSTPNIPMPATTLDANKKIQTIIVFYSDNSFEIFNPAK